MDVLEEVAVDRAQVRQIEVVAGNRLQNSVSRVESLDPVEGAWIAEAKAVLEDGPLGIDVRIVTHFFASERANALMCARRCSAVHPSRSNISNIAMSSASKGLPSISCRFIASSRSWRSSATSAGESFFSVTSLLRNL